MLKGDWAHDADSAIRLCVDWAKTVSGSASCELYLFGSAIYEDGAQFDAQLSDLDIVVVFQEELDASERAKRLLELRAQKFILESRMLPTLNRTNCTDPGVSVVPVSALEVELNIHKSGARQFFDRNIFLDLSSETTSIGLLNAGSSNIAYEARQALEYVQKIRNQFLAVSANATGGISDFDGADPLPKSLCRVAAQLISDAEPGAWYDTRFGLEFLWDELSARRTESAEISTLYRKVSIRRGGRGRRAGLDEIDQLLLAELLYDRAASFRVDPMVVWEIRFSGTSPSGVERDRILRSLRDLVPDGQVIAVKEGSIIVRLRSSKRAYMLVRRLDGLGVLTSIFDVKDVNVSEIGELGYTSGFDAREPVDLIAKAVQEWRPHFDSDRVTELDFEGALFGWLSEHDLLKESRIQREARVSGDLRTMRVDLLVQLTDDRHERAVAVELVRLKNRHRFFDVFERVRSISLPTVLVVVAPSEILDGLESDLRRVEALEGSVRVVTIRSEA